MPFFFLLGSNRIKPISYKLTQIGISESYTFLGSHVIKVNISTMGSMSTSQGRPSYTPPLVVDLF